MTLEEAVSLLREARTELVRLENAMRAALYGMGRGLPIIDRIDAALARKPECGLLTRLKETT